MADVMMIIGVSGVVLAHNVVNLPQDPIEQQHLAMKICREGVWCEGDDYRTYTPPARIDYVMFGPDRRN